MRYFGGFRIALESFGAKFVYSNEYDKYAKETYQMNFGEIPDDDIRYVDEKDIPDHDILCASFPCQSFSVSGKQLGFCDKRGILFFDVARIIREKRPMVVLLENVKNTIIDLGYSFQYSILNPVDYCIPQKRERIYGLF